MSKPDINASRFMSLILRHQPEKGGLHLDANGWVEVDALLKALQRNRHSVSRPDLDRIVAESDKKRFAYSDDGTRIRASQGHSVEVDLQLAPQVPPDVLFHGTPEKFLASIRRDGLRKGERHHVHLSHEETTAMKVGERRGRPVLLCIKAGEMHRCGHLFYVSANGVWLVDAVPPEFIQEAP